MRDGHCSCPATVYSHVNESHAAFIDRNRNELAMISVGGTVVQFGKLKKQKNGLRISKCRLFSLFSQTRTRIISAIGDGYLSFWLLFVYGQRRCLPRLYGCGLGKKRKKETIYTSKKSKKFRILAWLHYFFVLPFNFLFNQVLQKAYRSQYVDLFF